MVRKWVIKSSFWLCLKDRQHLLAWNLPWSLKCPLYNWLRLIFLYTFYHKITYFNTFFMKCILLEWVVFYLCHCNKNCENWICTYTFWTRISHLILKRHTWNLEYTYLIYECREACLIYFIYSLVFIFMKSIKLRLKKSKKLPFLGHKIKTTLTIWDKPPSRRTLRIRTGTENVRSRTYIVTEISIFFLNKRSDRNGFKILFS